MLHYINGFGLEGVRVGQTNNPSTNDVDVLVTNQSEFDANFPNNTTGNTFEFEYLVWVISSGPLEYSVFGWSKNDRALDRIWYDSKNGRFAPLYGSAPIHLGTVRADLNTTNITIDPRPSNLISNRLSVGPLPGTTLGLEYTNSFTVPPAGTVRVHSATGELIWNPQDLITYEGLSINYQPAFFSFLSEPIGSIGDKLALCPIPRGTETPILRIGYKGQIYSAVAVADDASFSDNPSDVEWSRTSGSLKFNSALHGDVYYDGVILGFLTPPKHVIQASAAPQTIPSLPGEGADIYVVFNATSSTTSIEYVDTFTSGSPGVLQISGNQIKVSDSDAAAFSRNEEWLLCHGDLNVEAGITLRLSRSENKASGIDGRRPDVFKVYESVSGTIADPIIASSQVPLPIRPLEGIEATAKLDPELDTFFDLGGDPQTLAEGIGYIIDTPNQSLFFAKRVKDLTLPATSILTLPDPLILESNLVVEAETSPGSLNWYSPEKLVDPSAGVVHFIERGLLKSGTATLSGSLLTDTTAAFTSNLVGMWLRIKTGQHKGLYRISAVTATTLQVDSSAGFTVSSSEYEILAPSVVTDLSYIPLTFVDPSISVSKNSVVQDQAQYSVNAESGTIQFKNRLLEGDTIEVRYTPKLSGIPLVEPIGFRVRKEDVQPHPQITNTLRFNPSGKTIDPTRSVEVFRGGRPQTLGAQVLVDRTTSTITFLKDSILTDALPHGEKVGPEERVYVDYWVTQALGGENTVSTKNKILTVPVTVVEGSNSLSVSGDYTQQLSSGRVIKVDGQRLYRIQGSAFSNGVTTVSLDPSQVFTSGVIDPSIEVTNRGIPDSLFQVETSQFGALPNLSNAMRLPGDRTANYQPGTIVKATGADGDEMFEVTASAFDGSNTNVVLSANASQQYQEGEILFSSGLVFSGSVTTQIAPPVAGEPYVVWRANGETGVEVPATLEASGKIQIQGTLGFSESYLISYTKQTAFAEGTRVRVSYTSKITPSTENNLLGGTLSLTYGLHSPDSFYFRVVPLDLLKNEASEWVANNTPSGSGSGPRMSNAVSLPLYKQGLPTLRYEEKKLSNYDAVARSILTHYHAIADGFDTFRRRLDGVIPGNNSGTFKFDGTLGQNTPSISLNHIDDIIKVSDAPFKISGPPWVRESIGTYQKSYLPGPKSRFYPTQKTFQGVSSAPSGTEAGAEVLDLGSKNVLSITSLGVRAAWAVITEDSLYQDNLLVVQVDNALGSNQDLRPGFEVGMSVLVLKPNGTLVGTSSVVGVSLTSLTLNDALMVSCGDTICQNPSTLQKFSSADYGLIPDLGAISYVPANGTNHPIPDLTPLSGTMRVSTADTSPRKIPALFGRAQDDDGGVSLPVQSDPNNISRYLKVEQESYAFLAENTTPTLKTSGSLESGLDVLTASANFPSPQPQIGDLVRVDGSSYRPVTAVTANSVSVTIPFSDLAAGPVSFEVTVSPNLATGTVLFGSTSTTIVSSLVLPSTVKRGHTLVIGTERRQIKAVYGDTMEVTLGFSSPPIGSSFRVTNSLATFGGTEADCISKAIAAVRGLTQLAIEQHQALDVITNDFDPVSDWVYTAMSFYDVAAEGCLEWLSILNGEDVIHSSISDTFARGLSMVSVANRLSRVSGWVSATEEDLREVEFILGSGEKYYENRYLWIDFRINLEKGTLAKMDAAKQNRLKIQEQRKKNSATNQILVL